MKDIDPKKYYQVRLLKATRVQFKKDDKVVPHKVGDTGELTGNDLVQLLSSKYAEVVQPK